MVCSTLPQGYRTPEIITPNKVSSAATESSYTALYTFIISVIMLNGGSLQEQKLDRYLSRTNADSYTPIDRTDRLIQRLCKEGYIVRNREMDGGEEVIEYMVGPRGKAEVGSLGVAELAREVYGFQDGEEGGSRGEEFESRLQRSLGLRRRVVIEDGGEGNGENGNEERQAGNGNGSAGESDASGG